MVCVSVGRNERVHKGLRKWAVSARGIQLFTIQEKGTRGCGSVGLFLPLRIFVPEKAQRV